MLLGPRGTGKSFLLEQEFSKIPAKKLLWIDLLDADQYEEYLDNPALLAERVRAGGYKHVVIDEIQKIPALLDIVHKLIEKLHIQFILSGSSVRKLKRGGGNLLAGRAFSYNLDPFSHVELGGRFNLQHVLEYGLLPKLYFPFGPASNKSWTETEKTRFLQSYVRTYLQEEILIEQLVRKIRPFRSFLRVSAQMNGKIVDYTKIGDDVGVDHKTVGEYFSILEDTLLGFLLHPYHRSIRKRQGQKPKFYLFDTGVKRALEQTLNVPLVQHTTAYGDAFEHFVVLEIRKIARIIDPDIDLSFFRTHDGAQEIDLILEKPGKPPVIIEIKSSDRIPDRDIRKLAVFRSDFPKSDMIILCRERMARKSGDVLILHWAEGIRRLLPLPAQV
ncbi:MAG: hypothetical protein A2583_09355 [Bdellovibrionales bacterium RIFOXYD1_FULL_53_11]|nr:MAG: hypothetical protein A2583_09355 [Bdellovibrionales bacterium RIFOXYD1_FULL_53_11]